MDYKQFEFDVYVKQYHDSEVKSKSVFVSGRINSSVMEFNGYNITGGHQSSCWFRSVDDNIRAEHSDKSDSISVGSYFGIYPNRRSRLIFINVDYQ